MVHPKILELQKIPQHEQRSPEWFAQRKGKLTSSDAATVTGKNPYCTYDELLLKKCGIEKPFVGNVATLHGQKYEDPAIELYCRVTGRRNYNFGLINYTDVNSEFEHYNSDHDFLAGSPDGIAESIAEPDSEPVLLEVKCPYRRKIKMGYIPEYYVPQVQLNLYICNLKTADFIEYCPKTETLNIVRIYRDTKWLNEAFPKLINFWNEVMHFRNIGIEVSEAFKKKQERDLKNEKRIQNKKAKIEKEIQIEKETGKENSISKYIFIEENGNLDNNNNNNNNKTKSENNTQLNENENENENDEDSIKLGNSYLFIE